MLAPDSGIGHHYTCLFQGLSFAYYCCSTPVFIALSCLQVAMQLEGSGCSFCNYNHVTGTVCYVYLCFIYKWST